MNNDKSNCRRFSRDYLTISLEPDIHLSNDEQIHFDKCLSNLFDICHLSLILNCTLVSVSSISDTTVLSRDSTRLNHYLRVRQPKKFYWMRNIKQMYLKLRFPMNSNEQFTANLIEFHSRKRLPCSARCSIEQIKPIVLIYYIEEHQLRLNIRGMNSLLQLNISSEMNSAHDLLRGVYYKWSDEGHIRSTTIQFHIECRI